MKVVSALVMVVCLAWPADAGSVFHERLEAPTGTKTEASASAPPESSVSWESTSSAATAATSHSENTVKSKDKLLEEFARAYVKSMETLRIKLNRTGKSRSKRGLPLGNSICSFPPPDSVSSIAPQMQVFRPGGSTTVPSHSSVSAAATDIKDALSGNSDLQRVIFVTHGFSGSINDGWLHQIKNEILRYNPEELVVLVGWKNGANPDESILRVYGKAAANTQVVGQFIASVATDVHNSYPSKRIYGVGHSLGTHVMGKAARASNAFDRITGLDPAGLCFEDKNLDKRLSPINGTLVDVIHTDGYAWSWQTYYGTLLPLGDLDFYPNGGNRYQPGCYLWSAGCSHNKAIDYYTWSISNPGRFETKQMITSAITYDSTGSTYSEITGQPAEMGFYADSAEYTQTGRFYLQTNSAAPYVNLAARYFYLVHSQSGKVLDVCGTCDYDIILWTKHGGDNQQWFRDGQLLRNKRFPDRTMTFNEAQSISSGPWGDVRLSNNVHKRGSQRFVPLFNSDKVVLQWRRSGYRLDLKYNSAYNGGEIGFYPNQGGAASQTWRIDYV